MKCEECQVLVEEYFDGELDQRTAGAVSVHIESCSSCHTALDQLSAEHRVYESYDRDLDVSPAMWFSVQERLAHKNNRRIPILFRRSQAEFSRLISLRFSVATSVAFTLLAVAATVAVIKYLDRQETPKEIAVSSRPVGGEKQSAAETDVGDQPLKGKGAAGRSDSSEIGKGRVSGRRIESVIRTSDVTGAKRNPKTPEQLVREAEKKYLSAIALLTRDAEQRQSLDLETRVKLDGAMAAIDRTIVATRKAVRRNPNDPLAVRFMLAAYSNKIDVLKEMASY